jgi:hypothetical protein
MFRKKLDVKETRNVSLKSNEVGDIALVPVSNGPKSGQI